MAFRQPLKYGQRHYDFDEGIMAFIVPRQLLMKLDPGSRPPGGMTLMFHPDFYGRYPACGKNQGLSLFPYERNEALHLLESEELVIEALLEV